MTLLTAAEFLRKLKNKRKQPESALQLTQERSPLLAISLFFARSVWQVDLNTRLHANIAAPGMCPCSSADRASALLEP